MYYTWIWNSFGNHCVKKCIGGFRRIISSYQNHAWWGVDSFVLTHQNDHVMNKQAVRCHDQDEVATWRHVAPLTTKMVTRITMIKHPTTVYILHDSASAQIVATTQRVALLTRIDFKWRKHATATGRQCTHRLHSFHLKTVVVQVAGARIEKPWVAITKSSSLVFLNYHLIK